MNLKLLIAGKNFKAFHLKEFGDTLKKFEIDYELVDEIDSFNEFPSRNVKNWFLGNRKFMKLMNEIRPDAVFIDAPSYFALKVSKLKIPVFLHLRGDFWSEIKWARDTLFKSPPMRFAFWWINRINEKSIKNSTTIVPICKYLAGVSRKHYPQKSIEVLYQGIDPSRWYPAEKMELKHPCVGLLQHTHIWGKTREMFLLTKALEAMPDVTFYWVGDGPYRDKVLPTLSKYKNFKWLGYLKYPDGIRKYFSSIDVYALVSGIDMSPLTLLEAQLMELPVVATKVGGIPELMEDRKTGYLVKKGDPNDLIEKLTILLNDKNKARQMGKEGRKFVENNFTWDIITKRFVDILKNSIKD